MMSLVQVLNVATPFTPPSRLCEGTHRLAQRGLSGEFGRQMVEAAIDLDEHVPAEGISEERRYALAVKLIAETAPLRLLEDELIVGSATYLEAPYHRTPIHGGPSTSHLTLGFDRVLEIGYAGLRAQIEERLARGDLDAAGVDLLHSMLICLDAAQMWHGRYVAALREQVAASQGTQKAHYERLLANLIDVPEHPPTSYPQAVQALWFTYAFQRLCGNWSGIGRIDLMLNVYLERDLREGRITLDEAREILAHFWIKGTEWIGSREWETGDAQHYQNIVLGGVDVDGNPVVNEVTYLVLDVVEELHISDFPVAVRINRHTPRRLLRRIAEVQRLGGGIVSVYNEEVILDALSDLGIPPEEARTFANDGCWEVIIPGKTAFAYIPFDLVVILQEVLGLNDLDAPVPDDPDFEAFYRRFVDMLGRRIDELHAHIDTYRFTDGRPATCISMMIDGCIEQGRGYYDRGSRYVFVAPHAGGMADVANSLSAIRDVVYERKLLSLGKLVEVLRADWEGHEFLRRRIWRTVPAYGNDDPHADAMMERLFDDYTGLVWRVPYRNGVHRPAGISTFGREIEWRAHRKATAHGFKAGDMLATNFSPTPGTDREGPTAALKSYCKMRFRRLPNGGTLELKLHPTCVKGEDGSSAMVALLESFVRLGGFYLNIDVIDSDVLIDAQRHPERYPNLAVRISGWCARFNTLSKDWQDMIIQRTQQWM
jgi:formate C-acetyltransferase